MTTAITKTSDALIASPNTDDLLAIRKDTAAFPRLRAIPEDQAVKALADMIYKAVMYRGQKADAKFVQFTAAALRGELLADLAHCGTDQITIPELAYAIRREVIAGEEMYGVNVASLYKAVVRYCKGEGNELRRKAESPADKDRLAVIKQAYAGEMLRKNTI